MSDMNEPCPYSTKEKLYWENFKELNSVKFTLREIDIVACIHHNRGEKKIAMLLGIMPKTVNTHIYNLMQKLRCNSRDHIIDFFESSGKLEFIQQYYLLILIENNFVKNLKKIGREINPQKLTYSISYDGAQEDRKEFFDRLSQHLKLANIDIVADTNISRNFIVQLDEIEKTGYHIWLLQLIKLLTNNVKIDGIISDFVVENKSLSNFLKKKLAWTDNCKTEIQPSVSFFSISSVITSSLIILFTILGTGSFIWHNFDNLTKTKLFATKTKSYKPADNAITRYYQDLSVYNLTVDQANKNYNIIRQFNSIIEQVNLYPDVDVVDVNDIQPEELINCIYNFNAFSSYYIFKEHNAKKAEGLLQFAKKLAEIYLQSRSKVHIDFNQLSASETYAELSTVNDLTQMYAVTIFYLGRSLFLQKKLEMAEKYFKLSAYLGNKTNLYVEVLSTRIGLELIRSEYINVDIKNHFYDRAKRKITESMRIFKQIQNDNKKYKFNYRPYNDNPNTIIPKDNSYNLIDCYKNIIRLYTQLIQITDDKNEQLELLNEIISHFTGNHSIPGIQKLLCKPDTLLPKIVANFYNQLGYLLLKLYDRNISCKRFNKKLIHVLNLVNGDDLNITYQIFELSKNLTRNTEHPKADAYDGLAKVCERLAMCSDHKDNAKQLTIKIDEFKKARDKINKELNRIVIN